MCLLFCTGLIVLQMEILTRLVGLRSITFSFHRALTVIMHDCYSDKYSSVYNMCDYVVMLYVVISATTCSTAKWKLITLLQKIQWMYQKQRIVKWLLKVQLCIWILVKTNIAVHFIGNDHALGEKRKKALKEKTKENPPKKHLIEIAGEP